MRTYVTADIHGNYKALKQCLERSNFDYDLDKLIILGDIIDGYPDTYLVIEELLKIKNCIFILGNHDDMFMKYFLQGRALGGWIFQGGIATLNSYLRSQNKIEINILGQVTDTNYNINYSQHLPDIMIPVTHQEFFNTSLLYYELDKMLFVHGGIDDEIPIYLQNREVLLWDRQLLLIAQQRNIIGFKKVFIGHTATKSGHIEKYNNLYMCDSGSGYKGRLCFIEVYTDDVFESDLFEGHNKY